MPRRASSYALPARWAPADVRYDPATHTSWLPDGTEVPHVTAVLQATSVSRDWAALKAISPRLAHDIEAATALGSAVHADCHALDDGEWDADACDDRVRPYIDAWAQCKADMGLEPVLYARERYVFHPGLVYAGIQDGIVLRRVRGRTLRILPDLKTGEPFGAEYQTAAYEAAWACAHPDEPIDERWAIHLTPERRVPYRIESHTAMPGSDQHFAAFCAFLTTYRHQACRRRP